MEKSNKVGELKLQKDKKKESDIMIKYTIPEEITIMLNFPILKEEETEEKIKKAKTIEKRLDSIEHDVIIPFCLSMESILNFLTLPIEVRFKIYADSINYKMLVNPNQNVSVPIKCYANMNEVKYNLWICEQIEKAKKLIIEYRKLTNDIHERLFDYLISTDYLKERTKIYFQEDIKELNNIINDYTIITINEIYNIISNVKHEYCKEERDTKSINSEEYMKKIINATIEKFPQILQQAISREEDLVWDWPYCEQQYNDKYRFIYNGEEIF